MCTRILPLFCDGWEVWVPSLTHAVSFLWLQFIKLSIESLSLVHGHAVLTMLKQTQALFLPHFPVSFFIYCSIFLPPDPTHDHIFQRTYLFSVFSVSFATSLNQLSSHPHYNAFWVINDFHSPNRRASFPSIHYPRFLTCDIFTVYILKYCT